VNRMAVSHWIEHQTPVGASRNSCTPHAACRTVQVRAGQQVLTAADPTRRAPPTLDKIKPPDGVH
jgi:hypothetical protein